MWTLVGSGGQVFQAETPIKCASLESISRIGQDQRSANLLSAVTDLIAYDQQLKEARRLLKYAVEYSQRKDLFNEFFLADARKLLAQPEIECA
jgi:hypothetical protein